ncbi:MAG: anion transporter, partial [Chlamydiia bacterium]|nr:anion transporter [Chlamydiia bacterium]
KRLMRLCQAATGMVMVMIGYNLAASFLSVWTFPLPAIALIPAIFLLLFAPKRKEILYRLDWHTLIFFIAMFILMRSVWETSSIQKVLENPTPMMHSIPGILVVSTVVSQLISNVPLVALYLPTLKQFVTGTESYMALAAGSTIAGNFLIFGAASNLIIIQNAEKRGEKGISFFEFAKYGIPLTLLNLTIYYVYLSYIA